MSLADFIQPGAIITALWIIVGIAVSIRGSQARLSLRETRLWIVVAIVLGMAALTHGAYQSAHLRDTESKRREDMRALERSFAEYAGRLPSLASEALNKAITERSEDRAIAEAGGKIGKHDVGADRVALQERILELSDELRAWSGARNQSAPPTPEEPGFFSGQKEMDVAWQRVRAIQRYRIRSAELYAQAFAGRVALAVKELGTYGIEDEEMTLLVDPPAFMQAGEVGERLRAMAKRL